METHFKSTLSAKSRPFGNYYDMLWHRYFTFLNLKQYKRDKTVNALMTKKRIF